MSTSIKKAGSSSIRENQSKIAPIILYLLLYVISVVVGVVTTAEHSYQLEVGAICEETITAPYDFVDEYSTELLRQEEMQKIKPVYSVDETIPNTVKNNISADFDLLEGAREETFQIYQNMLANIGGPNDSLDSIEWETILNEGNMAKLKNMVPEYITEQNIYTIAAMEKEKLTALKDMTLSKVNLQYNAGVITEEIENTASEVRSEIASSGVFSAQQADVVNNVLGNTLQANKIYDAEETEILKEEAASSITPIEYKKGQNIVQKGEKITQKHYEVISQIGLTSDDTTMLPRWIAGALIMLVLFGVAFVYVFLSDRTFITSTKNALSIFLLTIVSIGIAVACKNVSVWLCPIYLPAIVAAAFLRPRSALTYSVFVSVLLAFIMSQNDVFFFSEHSLLMMLSGMLGSAAAVLVLKKKVHRGEYVLVGLLAGGVNALINIAYGVIESYSFSEHVFTVGVGLANGLVCGLLSVGVLPIWESIFSLDTPSKLLEIASPGSELLKRLMVEAPGTYHHSVMTANLCEAGADAVGADALLARVSAYYHDIGKLENPIMYAENQANMENPHNYLEPKESAKIIISHAKNGKLLADKYKLPARVKDIILQHHGNSLASYFYVKAKREGEVDQKDYRYPGPRPQTKEAGILMLADTVEAAVRANNIIASGGDVDAQIEKLIKAKYDDGQLDECPLNRRDLKKIANAFAQVFRRANHERIVYPEEDEE